MTRLHRLARACAEPALVGLFGLAACKAQPEVVSAREATAASPTSTPAALPSAPARASAVAAGAAAPGPGPIVLSPAFPADVTVTNGAGGLPAIQADFDVLSWNSFIAANWPPGADGQGDPKRQPGAAPSGDNPTVWESWISTANVFLPGGKAPAWNAPPEIPAVCKGVYKPGMRVVRQVGKTPGVLSDTTQPFKTGPLIDQNGNYARFDIVLNRPMFDYILQQQLYSKQGQQAFTGTVKFPCGSSGSAVGAVMIKAAWKILAEPAKERAHFHSADVLIYTPASTSPKITETCHAGTVGLVGLHIAHKTNDAAQWVWSTFEHVDNAPRSAEVGTTKGPYNFFDATCGTTCPEQNTAAPRPWDPNHKNAHHTQVVRIDTLLDNEGFVPVSAHARNEDAGKLLRSVSTSSVWQYYRLISTQWPTDTQLGKCEAKAANPNGTPAPTFLANATLETFIQGKTPGVSSSCIGCHGNAAMTNGAASDFTYVLQVAK